MLPMLLIMSFPAKPYMLNLERTRAPTQNSKAAKPPNPAATISKPDKEQNNATN